MKTAWFLMHRIREIMKPVDDTSDMGGEGRTVEADWTYVGRKPGMKVRKGVGHMRPVFSLVERDGAVRSLHVPNVRADNINEVMRNASSRSRLMTDEAPVFNLLGWRLPRTKPSLTKRMNTCVATFTPIRSKAFSRS